MKSIDKTKPVMVTGASGYLASWITKTLLEEGINVHATVRDATNFEKVTHLTAMAKPTTGKLTLFNADLLDQGSFDTAMKDCELVIHTASPFYLTGINDPEDELIRPAREGTRNVLESVNRNQSVKRVVITSSAAAVHGDNADITRTPNGVFTEKDWNTTSSATHQPYAYSKTVAEKEAWAIAKVQNRWDLLTINPGWILGPSMTKRRDSTSISIIIQMGDGTFKSGVPELWHGIVDVRDVATAHIKAGFTPEASGRHLIVNREATLLHLSKLLWDDFEDRYPLPRKQIPKFLIWLLAPTLGFTRQYVKKNIGIPIKFDNSYSRKDLGMTYVPVERTIREHFLQLIDDGLLDKPQVIPGEAA